MKRPAVSKIAQLTAIILVMSMVVPVMALAAGFKDLVYKNGTVTGTVYSSVYSPAVTPSVYVYDASGKQLGVTTATYSVYSNVYEYLFSLNGLGSHSYIRVLGPTGEGFNVADSVYSTVYQSYDSDDSSDSGCCWGGGGTPSSSDTISVGSGGSVSADQLKSSFEKYDIVTLDISDDTVLIPASALESFVTSSSKVLRIMNDNGTYNIPLKSLKLKELGEQLDTSISELKLKATIRQATEMEAEGVADAAKQLGAEVLVKPVDFELAAVGKEDKTTSVDFGNHYVSRVLPLAEEANKAQTTGVLYDPSTKKLSFVPTLFSGKEALLKRNGNSMYAIIKLNKSFSDIGGHWSEATIKLLANKLVVDGVTATTFEPERSITRAEFAALVVRALGLTTSSGSSSSFKDVAASDWHAGVVAAAVKAKLVEGYEDGTFRPNATIKREELAAMVVRALDYAGAKPDVTASRQAALLAKYKDASSIVWAKQELATAIEAGVVDGMTDSTLGARMDATRAQSATMLQRLLVKASFIN
ncbi:S-layer homology domain-containing protein [Paenibacillus sp. YYML68]|uniref:S-layer homology domain-containing protein n=1 Tax=Paenibacillus sp. YYML68 TaxID=2909250 RepID=UPI0024927374|nr:S-layer homology domain-containing protein [Paenibacillus sp. YYML68]